MIGNVWEWCWDYADTARYGWAHSSEGPIASLRAVGGAGADRNLRDAGWDDPAWSARSSVRRGCARCSRAACLHPAKNATVPAFCHRYTGGKMRERWHFWKVGPTLARFPENRASDFLGRQVGTTPLRRRGGRRRRPVRAQCRSSRPGLHQWRPGQRERCRGRRGRPQAWPGLPVRPAGRCR